MREVVGSAVRICGFSIATDVTQAAGMKVGLDCDFIAAVRTDVPDILAHVAALTARAEKAEAERDAARERLALATRFELPDGSVVKGNCCGDGQWAVEMPLDPYASDPGIDPREDGHYPTADAAFAALAKP